MICGFYFITFTSGLIITNEVYYKCKQQIKINITYTLKPTARQVAYPYFGNWSTDWYEITQR